MKIALIGMGDIAIKAYLPILSRLQDIELVICSRNESTLISLCLRYKITTYCTDYKKLKHYQLDAAMIHTHSESHFKVAHYLLSCGLPVFVDKPGAMNFHDFEILANLAEQQNVPLFVGFNRRYIPIWQQQINQPGLTSLRWTKNRYNLPASPQDFIFNDFIHVIDGLNRTADIDVDDLQMQFSCTHGQLNMISIQWQQGDRLFQGSMNRMYGKTNETVDITLANTTYCFQSFTQGEKYHQEKTELINSPNWSETLHTKGFNHMLEDWLLSAEKGELNGSHLQRSVNSHLVCDYITQQLRVKNA